MNRLFLRALAWCVLCFACAGVCSASSIATCSVSKWTLDIPDPESGRYEIAQAHTGLTGCSTSHSEILDIPLVGSGVASAVAQAEIRGLSSELDEYGSNISGDADEQFVGAYVLGVTQALVILDELGIGGSENYLNPMAEVTFEFFARSYLVTNPRARRGGFARPGIQCEAKGYGIASCGISGVTWGIDEITGPTVFQQSGSAHLVAGGGDGGQASLVLTFSKPTIWDADGNFIPESEWTNASPGDPVVPEPNTLTLISAGAAVLLGCRCFRRIAWR